MTTIRKQGTATRAEEQAMIARQPAREARPVWPWEAEPYRLWSLLDMAQFKGGQLVRQLLDLDKARRDIDATGSPTYASTLAALRMAWTDLPLSPELIRDTETLIRAAADQSQEVGVIKYFAVQIQERFMSEYGRCGFYAVAATPIDATGATTLVDVYTDPLKWLGHDVFSKRGVGDARVDAVEACRCYALGRWTASVFHCMRVLEAVLRALAIQLRVDEALTYPIEMAGWKALREKIDKQIDILRPTAKTKEKSSELEELSRLNREFGYCQHEWRDYVSHARKDYNLEQAHEVLRHVKSIVSDAAQRIT